MHLRETSVREKLGSGNEPMPEHPTKRGSEPKPSLKPNPKILAATLAAAITTLVVYFASLAGVEIPGEAGAAITTLVAALIGYVTSER